MAKHAVSFNIPQRDLGKADVEFQVKYGWDGIRHAYCFKWLYSRVPKRNFIWV